MQTYQPPVADLLNFEECQPVEPEGWPDYLSLLDLTEEHIPALVQMMQDNFLLTMQEDQSYPDLPPGLEPRLAQWAPIHAWRALAQLKSTAIVEGMIPVLQTTAEDWAIEEFPMACKLIGPAVVEPLGALLQTYGGTETNLNAVAECVYQLPSAFPETRDRCVELLTDTLTNFEQNDVHLNGILVLGLVELKATEAIDLLERVYQAEAVDEFFIGNWPQIQIELGFKTEADFTAEELKPKVPPEFANLAALVEQFQRSHLPDASSLGLPMDFSQSLSDGPEDFSKLLKGKQPKTAPEPKGFGGKPKATGKNKKKR